MAAHPMPGHGDACPVCLPGDHPATQPYRAVPANRGVLASYECAACGTVWETWFDGDGWPIDRLIAPVTPEQAARNRRALADALKPVSAA
jgi:hypothetical protein